MTVRCSRSECISDSECRGACGKRPLAGGMPRIPQRAVVVPNRMMSHAKPPGLRVPYLSIVHMMELTSWSKKKRMVIIIPGTMAAKTHPTGKVQNSTKNLSRSGDVGLKELLTGRVILSRCANSPIWGMPIKMMMDIAAAYSVSPIRMYRWNKGFQLSAVERKIARSIVPTAPITAYKKAANERVSCALSSS